MRKYLMIVAAAGLVAGGAQAASKHGRMAGSELMPMAKVTLVTINNPRRGLMGGAGWSVTTAVPCAWADR